MKLLRLILYFLPLLLLIDCFSYKTNNYTPLPYYLLYEQFNSLSYKYILSFGKKINNNLMESKFEGIRDSNGNIKFSGFINIMGDKEDVNAIMKNGKAYKYDNVKKKWIVIDKEELPPIKDYIEWFVPNNAQYIKKEGKYDLYETKVFIPIFMGINRDSIDLKIYTEKGKIKKIRANSQNGLWVKIDISYIQQKNIIKVKDKYKLVLLSKVKDREFFKRILEERFEFVNIYIDDFLFDGDTIKAIIYNEDYDEEEIRDLLQKGNRGIYEIEWNKSDSAGIIAYNRDIRVFDDVYSRNWKALIVDSLDNIQTDSFYIKDDDVGYYTLVLHLKNPIVFEDSLRWGFCIDNKVYDSNRSDRIDSLIIRGKGNKKKLNAIPAILQTNPLSDKIKLINIFYEGTIVDD